MSSLSFTFYYLMQKTTPYDECVCPVFQMLKLIFKEVKQSKDNLANELKEQNSAASHSSILTIQLGWPPQWCGHVLN